MKPGKLPTPSLSAIVHAPPNRASFGRVEITFDPADTVEQPREERAVDRTHGVTCTLCHRVGHSRSNRKFHPRVTT